MKIRNGFVSNSSSTSFTFCFKGKKNKGVKPLCDLILTKYSECFSRSYDEWHCNAQDVVEAIGRCYKQTGEWNKAECVSIDKVIGDNKFYLEIIKKDIKDAEDKKETDAWIFRHFLEKKQELESKIKILDNIKKKGLTTLLLMDFGDNHGEVCDCDLGRAMDYDGRYIDINGKDLVVFTEQNR